MRREPNTRCTTAVSYTHLFLASGFPFLALPALSLLPLATGFLFLSAADLGLALALLPFGLPALAFLGLPGFPLCPELAVSLLPLQSLLLPLDPVSYTHLSPRLWS